MRAAFRDRHEAGRQLAEALAADPNPQPLVLALPRGGVLVAAPIARRLGAPLDLLLVRKIGAPGQPELAVAAVVEGQPPITVVDEIACRDTGADGSYLALQQAEAVREIERRRRRYREGRFLPELQGRTVIVVDDGVATGTTMRAALRALSRSDPASVVLAVPVAAADSLSLLAGEADRIVCLHQPTDFRSVGGHYEDFHQVDDEEVLNAMATLSSDRTPGPPTS
ncbi:MAG: phosphoribosyltransferase [Caldimonas sp.]|uniref:phosphoribosyltransferase n=1 Tax=Caldimonas sp. TaxID=2838790 RepID=UPI003919CCA7